jgi:hypothetical protein
MSLSDDLVDLSGAIMDFANALEARPITLQGMRIELGNSNQPNSGLGIDNGSYYQLNMSIGQTLYNNFSVQVQADGSAIFPEGLYAVIGGGKIIVEESDTFPAPIQMVLATGSTQYPFPGVYQDAVQSYPEGPVEAAGQGTTVNSNPVGMTRMSGTISSNGTESIWLAFTKIAGTGGNIAALQGYVEFLKIG